MSKDNLQQNLQLEGEANEVILNRKWHCNGDCQFFGDILGCPGERNEDNNSKNNCPYYLPEV